MGLRIKIESLGAEQKDFYQVREELLAAGKKFDSESLRHVPYDQLSLCLTAVAGTTMCGLTFVQEEKTARRERFLTMDDAEFQSMKNFLHIERMWDDVAHERLYRILPHWMDLSDRQQLWLKLNCIYNHIDNPQRRGGEALILIKFCAVSGSIPLEVCPQLTDRLRDLLSIYPARIEDITFRDRISSLADIIIQFLPSEERSVVENEEIRGYSCTSDCYRVILP